MTREQLRAFVYLLMCADPWPVDDENNQLIVDAFADEEAMRHGFNDWVEAYHAL
jgi:hypothetical protein